MCSLVITSDTWTVLSASSSPRSTSQARPASQSDSTSWPHWPFSSKKSALIRPAWSRLVCTEKPSLMPWSMLAMASVVASSL